MRRSTYLALALALLPAVADAHGQSKGVARLNVEGRHAELTVTFAVHDLQAALPELDPKKSGRYGDAALDAIAAHVAQATALAANGEPCKVGLARAEPIDDPPIEVRVKAAIDCPKVARDLDLELHYLPGLAPPHLTIALVTAGATRIQHTFTPQDPRVHVELAGLPRASSSWTRWLARHDPVLLLGAGLVALMALAAVGVVILRRRRG